MTDHQSSSLSSPTTQNATKQISSFLGSPRFLNGFSLTKSQPDSGSSPTSILETKQFSNFNSNPFGFNTNTTKPTKISQEIKHPSEKSDSENGIALALVLIQENPSENLCTPNSISGKVLFGSKLKIQIPSLPQSDLSQNGYPESPGDFGIKTRNLQLSGAPTPTGLGSPRAPLSPLSLKEMELSEEYTRVISHGSNPKITHIYDDCVVESCCESPLLEEESCLKNLEENRAKKAFFSEECRSQEMILMD